VDAIQNDKDTVTATTVSSRLANAERAVRGKEAALLSASHITGSVNTVQAQNKDRQCNFCKKQGHIAQKCWKMNPHLRPRRQSHGKKRERNSSGSPAESVQSTQSAQSTQSVQGAQSSQNKDRQGPPASKRQKINVVRARATALYTHAPQSPWLLDSAATSHVCWDQSCFTDIRPHHEWLDTAGDPVKTEGIGTVKLSLRGNHRRTIVLKNVYYAPRVGMNLVSVTKLLRDRYSVVAHSRGALLQRGSRTIGKADLTENDLLVLRCIASIRSSAYASLAEALDRPQRRPWNPRRPRGTLTLRS